MKTESVAQLLTSHVSREGIALLRSLGSLAEARGTRAFVVGGLVRDLFLGLHSEDLDIVVEESAIDFAAATVESLGGAAKAHTRFGTVILVVPSGRKIDLATARSEAYERPGALPSVTAGGIDQDLMRRDFTINAMAVLLNPDGFGLLLDHCGGRRDMRDRVLRVLTNRSFEDDPTRILRGVRFSARFGMEFEDETERLLRRAVAERRTDTVSGERLLNEFLLILREGDPAAPVGLLIEWGILRSIVGGWELEPEAPDALRDVVAIIEGAPEGDFRSSADRPSALMLSLLAPVSPAIRDAVLERLSAGRKLRELARELGALEDGVLDSLSEPACSANSAVYGLLRGFSPEAIVVAQATRQGSPAAERMALYCSRLWHVGTEINGAMLAGLGVSEGRLVGEILHAILNARLDGEVRTFEEELALARGMAQTLTRSKRTDNVSGTGDTREAS
ncbi:MAG: CCA tRNA nucleotidyltransferase [Candidatus Eisenbacteria bacterium]|nr:CCA tRNA nucleotidyltransferase [Candidatus Eisenbacteria bacterium]